MVDLGKLADAKVPKIHHGRDFTMFESGVVLRSGLLRGWPHGHVPRPCMAGDGDGDGDDRPRRALERRREGLWKGLEGWPGAWCVSMDSPLFHRIEGQSASGARGEL